MYPCHRLFPPTATRREFLRQSALGFGAVAATALLAEGQGRGGAQAAEASAEKSPWAARPAHFAAKAKHVIFLYMDGGVSQVDSFDPKPRLQADSGKPFPLKMEPTQFNNIGNTLGSPW